MAQFPTSVATDSNLYVAVNTLATTLVGALTSSGGNYSPTEIQVADTSGFPSVGFLTLDTEAISYSGISATPPRFTGISRGADGTLAAAHNNGIAVKHNVIAAHHNVLKEEIKAIEQNISDRLGLSSTQNIIPVGSISAPSLTFAGDLNTGLYWNSADKFSIVCGGNDRMTFETGSGLGISCWALFRATDGNQASPSISFINDTNSGFYSGAGDDVYLSLGGVGRYEFQTGQFRVPNGSASIPVLSFSSDTDTGIYSYGANNIGFSTGGTLRVRIDGNGGLILTTGGVIYNQDGSATAPSYTFDNDTNTGIYRSATDQMAFVAGGTIRFYATPSGLTLGSSQPLNLDNGSSSTPALTFASDSNTGIFLNATDEIGFTTGGNRTVVIRPTGNVDGTTYNPLTFDQGGTAWFFHHAKKTVSTSSVVIIETGSSGNLVMVFGYSGTPGTQFMDLVMFTYYNGTPIVIASRNDGSPATRTYTSNLSQLKLALSTGTYSVYSKSMDLG